MIKVEVGIFTSFDRRTRHLTVKIRLSKKIFLLEDISARVLEVNLLVLLVYYSVNCHT